MTLVNLLTRDKPDHNEYITTAELNKVTAENLAARLKQANLVTKQILKIN